MAGNDENVTVLEKHLQAVFDEVHKEKQLPMSAQQMYI